MSEMMERVARAIHAQQGRRPLKFERLESYRRDHFFGMARAAIEAMREPTKEMIAGGVEAIEENMDHTSDGFETWGCAGKETAVAGWRTMIDAALNSGNLPTAHGTTGEQG